MNERLKFNSKEIKSLNSCSLIVMYVLSQHCYALNEFIFENFINIMSVQAIHSLPTTLKLID